MEGLPMKKMLSVFILTCLLAFPAAASADDTIQYGGNPFQIIGTNISDELSYRTDMKPVYSTNSEGRSISAYTAQEVWFGMTAPVETVYDLSDSKILQLTLRFPANMTQETIIAAASSQLGEPDGEGAPEADSPAVYYAYWYKSGVGYFLENYGDYIEMYMTPAHYQDAAQYALSPDLTYTCDMETADIDGDGTAEAITLLGKRYDNEATFFENLYLLIEKTNAKPQLIPMPEDSDGGYEPIMHLIDFTGDKLPEIMTEAPTGGSSGSISYNIFSFANKKTSQIYNPDKDILVNVTGKYIDGYKAELLIKETGKKVTINLSDRKDIYEENGIYKNGKLMEEYELSTAGLGNLEVRDSDNNGIYELYGIQAIDGTCNADDIAELTTSAQYKNGAWKLMSAEIKPYPIN